VDWKHTVSMWSNDAGVMEALDKYLINQKEDLRKVMISLNPHNDGSPPYQMLTVFAKFVMIYNKMREEYVETDSYELTISQIANDPMIQSLIARMVGSSLDKGLSL